jgi:hypothetical protein
MMVQQTNPLLINGAKVDSSIAGLVSKRSDFPLSARVASNDNMSIVLNTPQPPEPTKNWR